MIPSNRGYATHVRASAPRAVALGLGLITASQASAQIPVLIFGRIQDAASATPVVGALIVSDDAASATRTDSLGVFAIELRGAGPYVVHAVQDGYEPTTFELPGSARSGISTLLLRRAPAVQDLVEVGDRIRITSEGTSGEFRVAAVRPDGLALRVDSDPAELEVPIASLLRLEIPRGRKISRLDGGLGGGLVGGLLGGVLGIQCRQTHYSCLTGLSEAGGALIGASIGTLVGLVVSYKSDEVWEEVGLPGQLPDGPRVAAPPDATPVTVLDDVGSDESVEMIVRNQTRGPVTAIAWWEGGARVPLGEVPAGATRAFVAACRSPGVVLFANVLASSGLDPNRGRSAPTNFILVEPGQRLEWTVVGTTSGVVEDYIRLPSR